MLKLVSNNFIIKLLFVFIPISIFVVSVLLFVMSLASVNFSYTKTNFIYYYLYTFNEIKNVPLISDDYIIYYSSPDGSDRMTNDVVFSNVNLNRKTELIKYVEDMGFKKYFDEYWREESWKKDNVRISIQQNNTKRTILFLVEKS
ncbi:hypothetical protein [Xenorhabdus bovienii]|uniref:hypothetical protein n=1 Tax=Xenorhabdus bovienii TaxID=40576 RepID=UPI00237D2331|nr:hypothetical protein [Xenorhabdus bovienii]MDE1482532.1 hypothetical protein [Xenorhabdus bovienii]MDE9441616.1 hypothetical protein [Xenorhabdus bovienii]MDE9548233.1 hypothetical protein [Xenorhabdus bovienii]